MTREELERYMNRRCLCGHNRGEHAHFRSGQYDREGKLLGMTGRIQVRCVLCGCEGFLDEVEREIGNPFELRARLGLADSARPKEEAP